jgi:glycosyltransferase involved in cell wall biosynthesis
MNILFLGQYRGPDNDGWSIASRRYLGALLMTGNNVAARPIYMAAGGGKISKRIEEAESNVLDKIDILIQNVLPDFIERHDCYNIGVFFTETRNIKKTGWVQKINLLDEVWVNSKMEKDSLISSGVNVKISIVPIPYKVPVKEPEPFNLPEIENKFVFYFVGENNERKNILALVQAFHREFSPEEDVSLLIKTNETPLTEEINEWRQAARLRKEYIPEVIIRNRLSEEDIHSMHKSCHCFVCPSRGEAFCIPIMDALYFNNPVICTDNIFPVSIFDPNIIPVNSMEVPVYCKNPPMPHIYTANETWQEIDILDLQQAMRFEYKERHIWESRQFILDNFSYQSVANKMKESFNVYNQ